MAKVDMRKLGVVFKREYLERVRSKWFLIGTLMNIALAWTCKIAADRHGMFLVVVDLDRAQLRHVFFRGVANITAVSEGDDPDRDQNDPENSGGLHRVATARGNAGP